MSLLTLRFAPSPNGELHLGHAYCVLINQHIARARDGRLLLRIEDIDTVRCRPEFEAGIYRDLEWLGVEWEPPVRRQSEHFAEYDAALQRLERDGLVYPAFMSRGDIRAHIAEQTAHGIDWPRDPDGAPLYPGLDRTLPVAERRRRIAEGHPFAWRLDVDAALGRLAAPLSWAEYTNETLSTVERVEARPAAWGDVILARRDVATSYHLAVTVDDALQGITTVVRGRDLYAASAVQRLLQALLGLPEPRYLHHRLILGPDGRKLSKSAKDTGLSALREAGVDASEIRAMLGLA